MNRTHITAVAGVALLAALSGCSSSSEAAPTNTRSTGALGRPSSTFTPNPSPAATVRSNPEDRAAALAEQAVRRYFNVTDQLGADPSADSAVLKEVAVGTALIEANNAVIDYRNKSRRQVGHTTLLSLAVRKVDLSFGPNRQPPVVPTAAVDVCYDVTNLNVVDGSGASVVRPERRNQALEQLGVVNYNFPNPDGWRVGYTTVKGDPCGAPL